MLGNLGINILQSVLGFILAPLEALNFVFNITANVAAIQKFIAVVAYVLPWSNILPIIFFIIALIAFRIGMAMFKFVMMILDGIK